MNAAGRWVRWLSGVAALALLFWTAGVIGSAVPRISLLGINIHGLALADYGRDPARPLAPLGQQIIMEARADATAGRPAPKGEASPTPSALSSPTPTSSLSPGPSPTPPPGPSATPTPNRTPTPSPSPSPTPSLPIPAGGIEGVVQNASNSAPLAGALVATAGASTRTDASGTYRLTLPAGFYSVTASAPGFLAQTQNAAAVPGMFSTLNFALRPTRAAIRGRVVDAVTCAVSCVGIVNATVSLTPGGLTAITDAMGAFSFPALDPRTYTLTASATGYVTAARTVSVAPGEEASVTVQLTKCAVPLC
jgi:hypothetical protein